MICCCLTMGQAPDVPTSSSASVSIQTIQVPYAQKNAYFAQKSRRDELPTNSQRLWLRLATVLSFLQRPPQTNEDH